MSDWGLQERRHRKHTWYRSFWHVACPLNTNYAAAVRVPLTPKLHNTTPDDFKSICHGSDSVSFVLVRDSVAEASTSQILQVGKIVESTVDSHLGGHSVVGGGEHRPNQCLDFPHMPLHRLEPRQEQLAEPSERCEERCQQHWTDRDTALDREAQRVEPKPR